MNELRIFSNPIFGHVRVSELNGEPVFCLVDVCKILDLRVDGVLPRLNQNGYNRIGVTDSMGRNQKAYFVNEKNLYRVIMRSDKEEAVMFQDWVCDEVLPAIRKTGAYSLPSFEIPKTYSGALMLAAKQAEQIEKQEALLLEQAPKALFADAVATSKRSCLVAELAKILQQNGINIGQNRLFAWMREHNYLGARGEYYNQPTQRSMELGIFEIKKTTITKQDGTVLVTSTTKVTGKGQIYFTNIFLS